MRHGDAGREFGEATDRRGRATGVPEDRAVLATAHGDYRSLLLPGTSWPRARWHQRPDVVVAVTPSEFWVSGDHGSRRYPIVDMVLASYGSSPRGALRIDFLEGDPLIVKLDDDGSVLEALRHQIWECEKQFLLDGGDPAWTLEVSPTRLAEADALLITAMAEPGPPPGRRLTRSEREELLRRSEAIRREARVDALRRRRRHLLGLPADGDDAPEDRHRP